jgi:hypothetical protein
MAALLITQHSTNNAMFWKKNSFPCWHFFFCFWGLLKYDNNQGHVLVMPTFSTLFLLNHGKPQKVWWHNCVWQKLNEHPQTQHWNPQHWEHADNSRRSHSYIVPPELRGGVGANATTSADLEDKIFLHRSRRHADPTRTPSSQICHQQYWKPLRWSQIRSIVIEWRRRRHWRQGNGRLTPNYIS